MALKRRESVIEPKSCIVAQKFEKNDEECGSKQIKKSISYFDDKPWNTVCDIGKDALDKQKSYAVGILNVVEEIKSILDCEYFGPDSRKFGRVTKSKRPETSDRISIARSSRALSRTHVKLNDKKNSNYQTHECYPGGDITHKSTADYKQKKPSETERKGINICEAEYSFHQNTSSHKVQKVNTNKKNLIKNLVAEIPWHTKFCPELNKHSHGKDLKKEKKDGRLNYYINDFKLINKDLNDKSPERVYSNKNIKDGAGMFKEGSKSLKNTIKRAKLLFICVYTAAIGFSAFVCSCVLGTRVKESPVFVDIHGLKAYVNIEADASTTHALERLFEKKKNYWKNELCLCMQQEVLPPHYVNKFHSDTVETMHNAQEPYMFHRYSTQKSCTASNISDQISLPHSGMQSQVYIGDKYSKKPQTKTAVHIHKLTDPKVMIPKIGNSRASATEHKLVTNSSMEPMKHAQLHHPHCTKINRRRHFGTSPQRHGRMEQKQHCRWYKPSQSIGIDLTPVLDNFNGSFGEIDAEKVNVYNDEGISHGDYFSNIYKSGSIRHCDDFCEPKMPSGCRRIKRERIHYHLDAAKEYRGCDHEFESSTQSSGSTQSSSRVCTSRNTSRTSRSTDQSTERERRKNNKLVNTKELHGESKTTHSLNPSRSSYSQYKVGSKHICPKLRKNKEFYDDDDEVVGSEHNNFISRSNSSSSLWSDTGSLESHKSVTVLPDSIEVVTKKRFWQKHIYRGKGVEIRWLEKIKKSSYKEKKNDFLSMSRMLEDLRRGLVRQMESGECTQKFMDLCKRLPTSILNRILDVIEDEKMSENKKLEMPVKAVDDIAQTECIHSITDNACGNLKNEERKGFHREMHEETRRDIKINGTVGNLFVELQDDKIKDLTVPKDPDDSSALKYTAMATTTDMTAPPAVATVVNTKPAAVSYSPNADAEKDALIVTSTGIAKDICGRVDSAGSFCLSQNDVIPRHHKGVRLESITANEDASELFSGNSCPSELVKQALEFLAEEANNANMNLEEADQRAINANARLAVSIKAGEALKNKIKEQADAFKKEKESYVVECKRKKASYVAKFNEEKAAYVAECMKEKSAYVSACMDSEDEVQKRQKELIKILEELQLVNTPNTRKARDMNYQWAQIWLNPYVKMMHDRINLGKTETQAYISAIPPIPPHPWSTLNDAAVNKNEISSYIRETEGAPRIAHDLIRTRKSTTSQPLDTADAYLRGSIPSAGDRGLDMLKSLGISRIISGSLERVRGADGLSLHTYTGGNRDVGLSWMDVMNDRKKIMVSRCHTQDISCSEFASQRFPVVHANNKSFCTQPINIYLNQNEFNTQNLSTGSTHSMHLPQSKAIGTDRIHITMSSWPNEPAKMASNVSTTAASAKGGISTYKTEVHGIEKGNLGKSRPDISEYSLIASEGRRPFWDFSVATEMITSAARKLKLKKYNEQ